VTTEDVADIKGMLANLNEEVVSLRRLREYLAEYVGNVNRQLAGAQAAPAAEGGSCYSQSYAVAPSQSYAAEGGSCYSESYAEAPARAYMPRTYAAPPRTYSARTYAASMPVQTIMEAVPTYEMAPQSFSQTSYRTTLLQRMLGRPNVRSFSQSSGSFGSLGAVPMMCGPGGCTPF
jgi:hypothetical protein